MADGLAGTTLANKWLDMLSATGFTAPTTTYVQIHTAAPGAAGTTAVCTGTVGSTRKALTWSAASAGSKAMSGAPSWASFDVGQTITDVSVWDAATAGNFLFSAALSASKTVAVGDTFNLTALSITLSPIAA